MRIHFSGSDPSPYKFITHRFCTEHREVNLICSELKLKR
jgi:hypothetical protein